MESIRFLMLFIWFVVLDARFSVYHSDSQQTTYLTFDCLYAYLHDDSDAMMESFIPSYHLVPYCRRPDVNEKEEKTDALDEKMGKILRFNELKEHGVTSAQLLTWMAPIDAAERYERSNISSQDLFYNCTPPWFGPRCQYTFDYAAPSSFADIVHITLKYREKHFVGTGIDTCYPFLTNCSRSSSLTCIDWREICDGTFDCLNGEDEQLCEQLELNQCTADQYRCHYGGQCIPLMFLHDGTPYTDCLDGSDEHDRREITYSLLSSFPCDSSPTFFCEEITCRNIHSLSCGSGQCVSFRERQTGMIRCLNCRHQRITRNLVFSNDDTTSIMCLEVLHCLISISNNAVYPCILHDMNNLDNSLCGSLTLHCHSEFVAIPSQPTLFGFFQLIYRTNRTAAEFAENVLPDYVCFNPERCPGLLRTIVPIQLNNNLTCCHVSDLTNASMLFTFDTIEIVLMDAIERCLTMGVQQECSHSSLFHCPQSLKCIPFHRLVDGQNDCYFGEDESYPACQLIDSNRFQCQSISNSTLCLSVVAIGDNYPHCQTSEDEKAFGLQFLKQRSSFTNLCDHVWTGPLYLREEENCEWWPCNNEYNRCDGIWQCLNGIDELNCPDSRCSRNEHHCTSRDDGKSICLSIEHFFETYINDCDTDNTYLLRNLYFDNRTTNDMDGYISWNKTKCLTVDKLCRRDSSMSSSNDEICLTQTNSIVIDDPIAIRTDTETSVCSNIGFTTSKEKKFLSTSRFGFFPSTLNIRPVEITPTMNETSSVLPSNNISLGSYCNRGVLIWFGLKKMKKCLCPPSYFGARCQWQNQRISLTLQLIFRSTVSRNVVLQVVIMLIDDDSGQPTDKHEQIIFLPSRDCGIKHNIYLLYPDRPKRTSANYSIRIDVFFKAKLNYYGSWHLPIPFSFLPVNRLAEKLLISDLYQTQDCTLSCGEHGRCRRYINNYSLYFCHCDQEYSGIFCDIRHTCSCSNDSVCLSPSICVCPVGRFGTQCRLKHSICQSSDNPCQNNGICIDVDDRIATRQFTCVCAQGYSGIRCEVADTHITIQFDRNLVKTNSSIFLHFVTAFQDNSHERRTTFKKIAFGQNLVSLYVQQPFHILLVELSNQIYLTVMREAFIYSEHINTHIRQQQHCPFVHRLLNQTLRDSPPSYRIKFYPLLCRQNRQLMCFYDETYMCLCDLDRFSNCFEFNRTLSYDCKNQNECLNGGHCFEDNVNCPIVIMCVCGDCYYGNRCQFSTKGFILALDPILGYHIKPNVSISQQPSIVKVSIAIVTLMIIIGLINGLLSIMTFATKESRDVGCGWYLLASSSLSTCTTVVLAVKFWQLVLSQQMVLTNRSYLTFTCLATDGILKALLAASEWLNACVAVERIFTILKGVRFDRVKSRKGRKTVDCSRSCYNYFYPPSGSFSSSTC